MPKRKEKLIEIPVATADVVEIKMAELAKQEQAATKPGLCNHQNRHAAGEVLCVLPNGHDGNHQNGNQAWSDEAGIPTRKHA